MVDFSSDFTQIKELLDKNQDILILTHENPTHDSIGSSLALYLGLVSLGKKVTIACPDQMTVELSGYVGVQKIVQSLSKKNFVISLDYIEGSIEKVSYNIEGDKFNLVIEPRPGYEAFDESKVHYSHAGGAASLLFTVDTIHLGGLKKLFEDDKDMFATKPIINIDRHANNAQYGQTNMIDETSTSTAEIVAKLLSGLGVALTEDIATNVFNALVSATDNFQHHGVTAETFALASSMMKAGAKRFKTAVVPSHTQKAEPQIEKHVQQQPQTQPASVPVAQEPQKHTETIQTQEKKPQKAPPEWLKPKIFKSSNIS